MAKAQRAPVEITPLAAALGRRIAQARELMGLTQEKMAPVIGVTNGQIHRYERGLNRMPDEVLWQLAEKAKVDLVWLVVGQGEPRPSKKKPEPVEPYASLVEMLARHRKSMSVTDEEVAYLTSQRFPQRLGDLGDDEWWLGQLVRYRSLLARGNLPGADPQPLGDEPPRTPRPTKDAARA